MHLCVSLYKHSDGNTDNFSSSKPIPAKSCNEQHYNNYTKKVTNSAVTVRRIEALEVIRKLYILL